MGSIAIFLLSWKSFHGSVVLLNRHILNNDITTKQKPIGTLVVLEDKSTDCAFEGINKAVVSNIYQFQIKYSHSSINIVRTHSSKCFLLVGAKEICFILLVLAARLINIIDNVFLFSCFKVFSLLIAALV